MILPAHAPLGMDCDGPAATFLLVDIRGHSLPLWGHRCTREIHNPLIVKSKTLDIALPFPKIGLDTGRCCGEAGVMGTNGSGRSGDRVAANDNGAAEARVRSAVLTIARLLGRQIAREQFERQASANDNTPVKETGNRQER